MRPLSGRRIVVTRPADRAARLIERLRARGAEPIPFPTIRLTPADPAPLDAAIAALDTFDWVIFTSREGVDAFFRRLDARGGMPAALAGSGGRASSAGVGRLGIAAIGPATAQALRDHRVEPALVPREYVAEALLEALGDVRGLRMLLPRADIARKALADGLRARGAEVVEVAAYRTVASGAPPPALEGVDAITFTSSSTVRHFVESGADFGRAKIVCIGPVTAATARELGLPVHAVASEYTEDGLIEALEGVFTA
ncbi:MAG: uroporphyrinogen-III synthase [Gemmatimonadetes bacterium]|nr:uroporphyrinogen-III synthase [Gemmatimonadota bacterium]